MWNLARNTKCCHSKAFSARPIQSIHVTFTQRRSILAWGICLPWTCALAIARLQTPAQFFQAEIGLWSDSFDMFSIPTPGNLPLLVERVKQRNFCLTYWMKIPRLGRSSSFCDAFAFTTFKRLWVTLWATLFGIEFSCRRKIANDPCKNTWWSNVEPPRTRTHCQSDTLLAEVVACNGAALQVACQHVRVEMLTGSSLAHKVNKE